jgi:hypothetical protein
LKSEQPKTKREKQIQTVQEIIEKSGGFARLKRRPIKITNGDHPPLVIQYLGKTGVGAVDYLRVMRIEEVDGEISRVFEMSFECDPDGSFWRAVVWHCELTGETRFVYSEHPVNANRSLYLVDMDEMRTLRFRANQWDENLRELGYLEATTDFSQEEFSAAV